MQSHSNPPAHGISLVLELHASTAAVKVTPNQPLAYLRSQNTPSVPSVPSQNSQLVCIENLKVQPSTLN